MLIPDKDDIKPWELPVVLFSIVFAVSIIIFIGVVFQPFTASNPPSSWYMQPNEDCVSNEDMDPAKEKQPQQFLEELHKHEG